MDKQARLEELQEDVGNLQQKLVGTSWKHFKGNLYIIESFAIDEEKMELTLHYRNVENGHRWNRTWLVFNEIVDKPEHNYYGPRFVRI